MVRESQLAGRGLTRCRGRRSAQLRRTNAGQAMVELVISATVLLLLIFAAIQLAMIGNVALSVIQYSYVGARYAAVNGKNSKASSFGSTIRSNVNPSPTINDSGLSTPTVASTDPNGNLAQGSQVTVTVSYDLSAGNKLFLPAMFGIKLPTTLSNSTTTLIE